jgi:hypothetical protein
MSNDVNTFCVVCTKKLQVGGIIAQKAGGITGSPFSRGYKYGNLALPGWGESQM